MSGVIVTIPKVQFSNALGIPVANGTLSTYVTATTTPAPTYQDAAMTIANTNPVVLDSGGFCTLWLDPAITYRFVLKTALGATIWTVDGIIGNGAQTQSFINNLAASSGASMVGFVQSGTGAVTRTLQDKNRELLSLRDFPVAGDGVANDSPGVQQWVNEMFASGRKGFVPPGRYLLATTVTKPQGFNCPSVSGAGADTSVFIAAAAGTGFKIKGGSGRLSSAVWEGVGFEANATGTCIEVADQDGVLFRDCTFDHAAIGILPHNEAGFTEYVIAENCTFFGGCKQAMVYKRTAGTDSFHGTGLRNCVVEEASGETVSKVEIGGALSTNQDIIVYNAPMSAQFFKNTNLPVIQNNSTRFATSFHGLLTFESFGGVKYKIADGANSTYIAGSFFDVNNLVQRGKSIFVESAATTIVGTVPGSIKPYKIDTQTMTTSAGGNVIATLPFVGGEIFLVSATFRSNASAWTQTYLLACTNLGGIGGVVQVAMPLNYFGGDQPAPVFTMSNQNLVATQTGWTATITADVSVAHVGMTSVWAY